MKVMILHGAFGDANDQWIPWLGDELRKNGFEVYVPSLPGADAPDSEAWVEYVLENVPFELNGEMMIVGYSAGAAVIPQLLQKMLGDVKIRGVIMVAGFHTDIGWSELKNIQRIEVDYNRVRRMAEKFILVQSDNDPCVHMKEAEWLRRQLKAKIVVMPGQGHFNVEHDLKYKKFPELLEIIETELC